MTKVAIKVFNIIYDSQKNCIFAWTGNLNAKLKSDENLEN